MSTFPNGRTYGVTFYTWHIAANDKQRAKNASPFWFDQCVDEDGTIERAPSTHFITGTATERYGWGFLPGEVGPWRVEPFTVLFRRAWKKSVPKPTLNAIVEAKLVEHYKGDPEFDEMYGSMDKVPKDDLREQRKAIRKEIEEYLLERAVPTTNDFPIVLDMVGERFAILAPPSEQDGYAKAVRQLLQLVLGVDVETRRINIERYLGVTDGTGTRGTTPLPGGIGERFTKWLSVQAAHAQVVVMNPTEDSRWSMKVSLDDDIDLESEGGKVKVKGEQAVSTFVDQLREIETVTRVRVCLDLTHAKYEVRVNSSGEIASCTMPAITMSKEDREKAKLDGNPDVGVRVSHIWEVYDCLMALFYAFDVGVLTELVNGDPQAPLFPLAKIGEVVWTDDHPVPPEGREEIVDQDDGKQTSLTAAIDNKRRAAGETDDGIPPEAGGGMPWWIFPTMVRVVSYDHGEPWCSIQPTKTAGDGSAVSVTWTPDGEDKPTTKRFSQKTGWKMGDGNDPDNGTRLVRVEDAPEDT